MYIAYNRLMRCLVIGASVVDVFSSLQSNDLASISNDSITFNIGDKVPVEIKEQALGGNGMNISVGLKRLKVDVTFYTFLGNDAFSETIENQLKKEKITEILERSNTKSDFSFILNVNDDRIIFSHHPTRVQSFNPPKDQRFDYIFLSSVGNYWKEVYQTAIEYATLSGTPIIFSPGSQQMADPDDTFFSALHYSEIILINKDEASKITTKFGLKSKSIEEILMNTSKLGPKVVSITDGLNGAYAYENNKMFKIKTFSPEKAPEKTGAGDAYASGFIAGFFNTKSIEEAMRWGSVNAHMAVQKVGAQSGLATQEELLNTLKKHDTFKATIIKGQ